MAKILYGVYNGKKLENVESFEDFDLETISSFNTNEPVDAIISNTGFLVFNDAISLRKILADYYKTVRSESCGRCTPCRIGSILIDQALQSEDFSVVDFDKLLETAKQMRTTSLCGIGKKSPEALIGALEFFKDKLLGNKEGSAFKAHKVVTAKCVEACPAHVDVPRYIDAVRNGETKDAARLLLNHYPFLSTLGRVCVKPCEVACRRNAVDEAVAIKELKRFAGDAIEKSNNAKTETSNGTKKIAIVGGGPAGVNCAYHLLQKGYAVTIFDQDTKLGGMALRGIPSYRLPRDILKKETDTVLALGATVQYEKKLGRDFSIESLKKDGFDAIFIAVGCAKGAYLGLKDENTALAGYKNGIDFLLENQAQVEKGATPRLEGDVAVVGCGNVAMDCVRVARRMTQGKVTLIYRRSLQEAPASREEIDAAQAEGVEFMFLTNPVSLIEKDGKLVGARLTKMQLTEPDERGRKGVKPIEGSEFDLPFTTLIASIGQKIEEGIFTGAVTPELGRKGNVVVSPTQETTIPGVFAGGDCASGPSTLINALAAGERAATSIDQYLKGEASFNPRTRLSEIVQSMHLVDECEVQHEVTKKRFVIKEEAPNVRNKNYAPVDFTMKETEAQLEAKRCMRCYRVVSVITKA